MINCLRLYLIYLKFSKANLLIKSTYQVQKRITKASVNQLIKERDHVWCCAKVSKHADNGVNESTVRNRGPLLLCTCFSVFNFEKSSFQEV